MDFNEVLDPSVCKAKMNEKNITWVKSLSEKGKFGIPKIQEDFSNPCDAGKEGKRRRGEKTSVQFIIKIKVTILFD